MQITKRHKVLFSLVAASIVPFAFGAISAKCQKESIAIGTSGYADQMQKLASKSITVGGAWADARFYAGKYQDNLVAVGVTDPISNDGVQARPGLKKGDIEAIQELLIDAITKSYEEVASKNKEKKTDEGDLTYYDQKDKKIKSIFQIYNHDGYTKVGYNASIPYNIKGEQKKAYKETPTGESEYLKYDSSKKQFTTIGNKDLKIQFIPSSDASLVTKATEKLQKYLATKGATKVKISVSNEYNSAASALKSQSVDIAFLPIDTWAKLAGDSSFILQAGRNVQIIDPYESISNPSKPKFTDEKLLVEAHNNYKTFNKDSTIGSLYIDKNKLPSAATTGYSEELKKHIESLKNGNDLPKVGYYRAYIYVNKDTEIYKLISKALEEQGSNWKLNWDDVKKHVKYGYTSTTSAASFIYPEQWFKKHFDGFKSFTK
ncbi:PhnD/SsuA/transferrin family substrate-binding protein [Metamycoplasma auris]|uniref:Phosphonate transport system substrate-binding protein n=1 Tax=Metamycoplasma auris TaxID=51363 RepID=A0A2W7GMW4_9BACT|nr:PhnD/SsuA/transferrin family substrate-binding protein [Metamycoplasma auris]PZV99252.1 hypothetical protein BCF89_10921 [Metamycoplasma auris]